MAVYALANRAKVSKKRTDHNSKNLSRQERDRNCSQKQKNKPKDAEKLKELHDKFKQNVKEKRTEKPELPDDVKAGLDAIKDKKDALQAELKKLWKPGQGCFQGGAKEAVEKFKEANKERHQAIKAEYDALRAN